jgi:purine-binding chemotaxis protein CheW
MSIPETYILFELGATVYGINSREVLHIEMLEHISPVPHTAPAVDGVVFSRGQVVPALNLRARFGLPPQARDLRTRLIFIRFHERTVALIVDAAREFRKLPAEAVRATDGALHGIAGNYVSGVATLNERTVLILDLKVVLDLETALPALLDAAVAGAPAAS